MASRARRLLREGTSALDGLRTQLAQPDLSPVQRRDLERAVQTQEGLLSHYAREEARWSGRELADHLTPACRAFVPKKARPCFGAFAAQRNEPPNRNRKRAHS